MNNLVDDAPWHREPEDPDTSPADNFDLNYSELKEERNKDDN